MFRYFYALGSGRPAESMERVVQFGVWGRAILLVALFFLFLRANSRGFRPVPPVVPRFAPGELIAVG